MEKSAPEVKDSSSCSESSISDEVKEFFDLKESQQSFLDDNLLVGIQYGEFLNFPDAYKMLHDEHIPIFITTDFTC